MKKRSARGGENKSSMRELLDEELGNVAGGGPHLSHMSHQSHTQHLNTGPGDTCPPGPSEPNT